jgi:ribosomal protein L11 methylase PrmA
MTTPHAASDLNETPASDRDGSEARRDGSEARRDGSGARRDGASFRDPSGFVFWREGRPYRQIQRSFAAEWDAFEASPLKQRLLADGRLIAYETVSVELAQAPGAHAVIRPERIDVVSYPYEWTFGGLREAALLTLDIELEALAAGWSLKDASAYNIQFRDARPIHIDSLSFEPYEDGAPWVAYRQFCEQFLAPLALVARRDVRLAELLRLGPDGIPLDLASRLLPWRTRLNFGLLSHLHLHAGAQVRHAADAADAANATDGDGGGAARRTRLPRARLEGLLRNLRATVAGLDWRPAGTEWADYAEHTSYGERAAADKDRLVDELVREVPGTRLWDLGANTGRFSRIAADAGKRVVALDIDPAAAERHFRAIRAADRTDILPLVADIANPSPALGWAGRERRSLLERADADVVMALALVHHLAIGRNVPLAMILGLFADFAPWAIVEFVPKDDPMVRRLLATRRDVFADYDLDGFRAAAASRFEIVREARIAESPRVLFLLRRR